MENHAGVKLHIVCKKKKKRERERKKAKYIAIGLANKDCCKHIQNYQIYKEICKEKTKGNVRKI